MSASCEEDSCQGQSSSLYDENEVKLKEPEVRSRELFQSEATDTYPVTALRGKCKVVHCPNFEAARSFQPAPDSFYYILGYNPETKRLATTQGQIRVGSMYQARMPECKPNVSPKDMPESSDDLEVLGWQPQSVLDSDLMMYLRAARSIAAFAGMCDGGSTEDGCQAASMDDTTICAMHMLHRFKYDTGRALQALVKAPTLRTIDKKWTEEDTKRFVKGLRLYGKNFFKIRKELLSHRETGELVEYYYFWKKTPQAAANRPHRRHRRHGVKRATTRSQRPASSEFLDVSSASECSDNDSDDSDSRDIGSYRCQNCFVTLSKDWNNAEKPSPRLCTKCRIYFKKYGEDRPLDGDFPYFQPVKDDDLPNGTTMLTRQRNSTDSKDKKKDCNSISSLDNLDSPLSDSKKSLGLSSPSALSTCSNSSTDREKKRRRGVSTSPSSKNHNHIPSDSDAKYAKRQRQNRSDSDSVSDSSSISGNEENGNEGDIETNQDELSSSSPPSTPCPSDSDDKQGKTTPVPTPVESTIKDKLNQLPRPEPQHPQPTGLPIVSSPTPTLPPLSSLPSQGFGTLPPLPAFAFRPQCPFPGPLYSHPRPPVPETLPSRPTLTDNERNPVSPKVEKNDTGPLTTGVKIKEEVVTPPSSPQQPQQPLQIKQEPQDSDNVINSSERETVTQSGHNSESYSSRGQLESVISKDSVEKVTHKQPFESVPPRQPFELASPREPYDLVSQKQQYERTAQREQLDSMTQRGPFDLMAQKEPYEKLTQRKPFELVTQKDQFELVSPKLEPVQSSSDTNTSQTGTDTVNSDLTSQAEVKVEGQSEPPEVEIMEEESDSDREGTLTPGPVPTPCNKEIHRSKSALFIKLLNRGEHNSCTRCDLIFKPLPDSKLARKREEREKRGIPSSTPVKEEKEKRKAESPPPNATADAQVISNIPPPHHSHQDRITPRSYQDTPALRQLSEYAKPHALGQDPRAMGGYMGFPPFMDPVRMAAMFPPNSRERLELELERDKRERDARERELREHELRNMEMREKLKAELEMKPPGFERLLPPGASPLDSHWLEIQRRYGHPLVPGAAGGSHIPGIYPPTSIASDLMARERDRLERLGLPSPSPQLMMGDSYAAAALMERLSAERLSAERLTAERLQAERMAFSQDPMIRLQMAGLPAAAAAAAAASSTPQAHTHTHAHSHTHLHLHQPDGVPPGPPLHPLLPPHLLPPGADPMSGVNGSNPTPPGGSSHPLSLPLGIPPPHHLLVSREQEMIQNDLYRRACTDPALAQQLQAHHEALQRMALERERFGSGHLPPPH